MFGIGAQELILLMIAALIIFGPQRLPEIAAQVGKAIRDFRRMSDELTGELQRSLAIDEPATEDLTLPGEAIAANATPNGVSDTIAQALRVETIPADSEPAAVDPTNGDITPIPSAVPSETVTKTEDMVISFAPVATKADPLVGVSLLDEPIAFTGEKPAVVQESAAQDSVVQEAVAEDTVTASSEPYSYQPTAVSESAPLVLESPAVQNGIADAWDAVITTEATAAVAVAEVAAPEAVLTVPEGYAYPPSTYVAAMESYVPPVRERIDPEAEPTIREKIENQTAAEAFRERRRLAHYQRARK
jgi:sec-independent protein translocase protein TatB